ncbi:MAG: hydantoinase/carbamoylase family amidase, partial [Acidimicrobiales bacterium]
LVVATRTKTSTRISQDFFWLVNMLELIVPIKPARLLDDLHTLRSFGAVGDGVVRTTFSDSDMAARRWLRDQMADAGLDASIDGVANVFGRSPNPGPALLIGSHSDTQPNGGWLDGAMGVIYGLEIARSLLEDSETDHLAVDAVAWSDEEGTYTSCLGASSFVGVLGNDQLQATNAGGESVSQALERTGLGGRGRAVFEPGRQLGYLEAHIEQGPHLEAAGLKVGVVTSIVGIRSVAVFFNGEQNHAGTTPMSVRADAGVAMFEFGFELQARMRAVAGPTSVWTIGVVNLEPGAQSIVPGSARLVVQFRDPEDATLDRMEQEVSALADELDRRGPVSVSVEAGEHISPTVMDTGLQEFISAAAADLVPGQWTRMPSAAGHDPMVLSHHMPCAMLFIPSIGGISHDFAEDSHEADIVTGCQVLANAAASILKSQSHSEP